MGKFIGIDGTPGGWLVVIYDRDGFVDHSIDTDIESVWESHSDAEVILIDIPIGLPEGSGPRTCDSRARERLDGHRKSSVFPVPVREATRKDRYEEAKQVQEEQTDGSLSTQSWAISDKIEQVDKYLLDHREAQDTIRESHPEVCFDALNKGNPMEHSKTSESAKAFWERVSVLEEIDPGILQTIRRIANNVDGSVSHDDILDALVLALTASPLTGELESLPSERETDEEDLPKQIWYARPH